MIMWLQAIWNEIVAVAVPMGHLLLPPVGERGAGKEAVCGKRKGI